MPNSLRSKLSKLRYKRRISEDEYRELIEKLNGHDKELLGKIRAEISEEYGDYDICEWFNDYDYEENDISEYRQVGNMSDILKIIDKYRESEE